MQLFYAWRNCAIIIQLLRTVCIIVSSKMCIEWNYHVIFYIDRTNHLLFYNYFTVYKCIVHWSTSIIPFLLLINNHQLCQNSFCQNTDPSVHSISDCWQLLNACNAMAWQGSKAACQRWWKGREAEKRVVKNITIRPSSISFSKLCFLITSCLWFQFLIYFISYRYYIYNINSTIKLILFFNASWIGLDWGYQKV